MINSDMDNSSAFNYFSPLLMNGSAATTVQDIAAYIIAPYVLAIIYYVISSLGIILNVFTIIIIVSYKPMHKQWTNWFIVNQSTIDTLAATMVMISTAFPTDLLKRTPGKISDEILCRIWFSQMPLWSFLVSSTYGIVGATFERYLAVVKPLWHKAKFKRKMAFAIIVVSWLVGPVYYIPFVIFTSKLTEDGLCSIYSYYINSNLHKFSAIFGFTLAYFAPLITMAYFYVRMIVVFRRKVSHFAGEIRIYRVQSSEASNSRWSSSHAADNKEQMNITGASNTEHSTTLHKKSTHIADLARMATKEEEPGFRTSKASYNIRNSHQEICQLSVACNNEVVPSYETTIEATASKESASTVRVRQNIIKTLVLVTVGFVLCWSWSEFYFLMFHLGYTHVDFTGVFYNFTVVMVFCSCCINPIIYCVKLRQFQNGIKWALCCIVKFIRQ